MSSLRMKISAKKTSWKARHAATNTPWKPLPPRHTRVVRMSGLDEDGLPFLEIMTIDLDDTDDRQVRNDYGTYLERTVRPRYAALSYTWGDNPEKVPLKILSENSRQHIVQVTPSLVSFLKTVQPQKQVDFLWVDQLSVDQMEGSDEKSVQIALMREIYERAEHVFIWLGESDDNSDLNMATLNEVLDGARSRGVGPFSGGTAKDVYELVGDRLPHNNMLSWMQLRDLFERRWFFRAWVIHEASARPEATTIYCGKAAVSSVVLPLIVRIYKQLLPPRPHTEHTDKGEHWAFAYNIGWPVVSVSQFLQSRYQLPTSSCSHRCLWILALDLKEKNATDPRDMIFCMTSYAANLGEYAMLVQPNYRLSCKEVYVNLVLWFILTHKNLDFLGLCAPNFGNPFQLPSWAPDWTCLAHLKPLIKRKIPRDCSSAALYRPGGDSVPFLTFNLAENSVPTLLKLSGIRLASLNLFTQVDTPTMKKRGLCSLNKVSMYDVLLVSYHMDMTARQTVEGIWSFHRISKLAGGVSDYEMRAGRRHQTEIASFLTESSESSSALLVIATYQIARYYNWRWRHISSNAKEVWVLRGGSILYILEKFEATADAEDTVLDPTGGRIYTRTTRKGDVLYRFIGECYIHGLMDGEILDMIGENPKREIPEALQGMDREFHSIYLA